MKPRLAISFSGGRTSALMLALCLERFADHEIQITFANTGCEHEGTLRFVDECDRKIAGGRVVWLEAVVDTDEGVGISHRQVDYMTASRDGRPFRDYIAKYGIPNATNPACTTRLKTDVMESYLQSLGWVQGKKLNYRTAVGIRADETGKRGLSPYAASRGIFFPLVDWGVTEGQVLEYWSKQSFYLQLPGRHFGNCTWCWQKTDRKLLTIAKHHPHYFDFPAEMERLYGTVKGEAKASKDGRRYFFRKHRSVADIMAAARRPFRLYNDTHQQSLMDLFENWSTDPDDAELDVGGSCSDGCEIFSVREIEDDSTTDGCLPIAQAQPADQETPHGK